MYSDEEEEEEEEEDDAEEEFSEVNDEIFFFSSKLEKVNWIILSWWLKALTWSPVFWTNLT